MPTCESCEMAPTRVLQVSCTARAATTCIWAQHAAPSAVLIQSGGSHGNRCPTGMGGRAAHRRAGIPHDPTRDRSYGTSFDVLRAHAPRTADPMAPNDCGARYHLRLRGAAWRHP